MKNNAEKPSLTQGWHISKNGKIKFKSESWISKLVKFFRGL